jgi:hypothetical protein
MQTNTVTLRGLTATNNSNIPFETAIFALYQSTLYDGSDKENYLSVSDLIAPVRKTVLKLKYKIKPEMDVSNMLAAAKGTSHHSDMELALQAYNDEQTNDDAKYIQEVRSAKEFGKWTVAGKFDMVTGKDENGKRTLKDLKHVSGYSVQKLNTEKETMEHGLTIEEAMESRPTYTKFQLQLSIYCDLNQDLDLNPYADILFMLSSKVGFGPSPTDFAVRFPVLPAEEVEEFIKRRIALIEEQLALDELTIFCSPVERGTTQAEYKVKRMNKAGNYATVAGSKFNNRSDVDAFLRNKGRAGDIIDETPASHKLCNYCPHYGTTCDQI